MGDTGARDLMTTNVYAVSGRVLIAGSCLEQVYPEAFAELAAEADQVYTLCLETTHVNMAITKLSAVFGTGQVERMVIATVDRSPHCTQMHWIRHEIERTLPGPAPIESVVVTEGAIVPVPERAIELSKTLAHLAEIVPAD